MQSIIIYSNPLEAIIWDTLMSGSLFPIILWIVSFLLFFIFSNWILKLVTNKVWFDKWYSYIAIFISCLISSFSLYFIV